MQARDSILVTGGAGYVGSHFAWVAHASGSRVVVLDDLSGGSRPALPGLFVEGDIGDRQLVSDLVRRHAITAVAHFAGKIQVGESVGDPAAYFDINVSRSLALLDAIRGQVAFFVFSSSAAVYGNAEQSPILETAALRPVNPYGVTKMAFEHALSAYGGAYGLRWAALRYFNAAGARSDGLLRESHQPETHLIPLALDAALGTRGPLTVFGDDYPTPDGTCIRDYVHVDDLADAHLLALDTLSSGTDVGVCNLGSGAGYSVREVIDAVSRELDRPVPWTKGARREGDPAVLVASNEKAASLLRWRPQRSNLRTIVADALRSRALP
jgi:UDP-glucose-4-epimerase GalE